MPVTAQEIRANLMSSDAEFQWLAREHSRYEAQIEQLTRQPYLSSEDLLQEIRLKKLRLRAKDLMEQMVARRRRNSLVR